jgi:hypothetical protein
VSGAAGTRARPSGPGPREDLLRRARHEGRPRRMEHGCSDGGRLTLEQRVSGVWEGLHAAGAAECPACHGRMEREGSAGRCGRCGAALL